jgi:hypothetical protein
VVSVVNNLSKKSRIILNNASDVLLNGRLVSLTDCLHGVKDLIALFFLLPALSRLCIHSNANLLFYSFSPVKDCYKMSRMSMSCYAAAKHTTDKNSTVARIQPKEKPTKTTKHINKYADMETTLSLDKYNGKLMNSIWGLYNR